MSYLWSKSVKIENPVVEQLNQEIHQSETNSIEILEKPEAEIYTNIGDIVKGSKREKELTKLISQIHESADELIDLVRRLKTKSILYKDSKSMVDKDYLKIITDRRKKLIMVIIDELGQCCDDFISPQAQKEVEKMKLDL